MQAGVPYKERREVPGDAVEADAPPGQGVDLVLNPVGCPVRRAIPDALAPFGHGIVDGDLGRYADWGPSRSGLAEVHEFPQGVVGVVLQEFFAPVPFDAQLAGFPSSWG
ncbi:hypothetical protein [Streptacidiphilus sp. MAP5-3]|uniref:hypothetical protein n=1 Tax=unclassified Streptacidiphilus TaxID=2643834 RepID=UPI0035144AFF